jgi:hypothetical protein
VTVEFVAIDDEQEIEPSELERSLYPVIPEGIRIPAMLTRLDPRSLVERPRETLMAMAAPSCIETGHPAVDAYGAAEAGLVTLAATQRGLDPDGILDEARREVTECEQGILALAGQLAAHGWVDAPTLDPRAGPS